jgi:hypothetical protein
MVAEVRPEYPSDWPAIKAVAGKLGIGMQRRCVNGSARLRSMAGRGRG